MQKLTKLEIFYFYQVCIPFIDVLKSQVLNFFFSFLYIVLLFPMISSILFMDFEVLWLSLIEFCWGYLNSHNGLLYKRKKWIILLVCETDN